MRVLYNLLPKPDMFNTWRAWAQDLVDSLERGEVPDGLPGINVKIPTTTYVMDPRDVVVLGNHAATPFNVTLPSTAAGKYRIYCVKNINAAAVTVVTVGAETIDGAATKALAQWEGVILATDGSDWVILADV